jgi:hypothetical protein
VKGIPKDAPADRMPPSAHALIQLPAAVEKVFKGFASKLRFLKKSRNLKEKSV